MMPKKKSKGKRKTSKKSVYKWKVMVGKKTVKKFKTKKQADAYASKLRKKRS